MKRSPFYDISSGRFFIVRCSDNYTNRFYMPDGSRLNIMEFLSRHLREVCVPAFDRVLVYSANKLFAVDKKSSDSFKSFFGSNKSNRANSVRSMQNSVFNIKSTGVQEDDHPNEISSGDTFYSSTVNTLNLAFQTIDRLMNDTETSTAVIVMNAGTVFSNLNSQFEIFAHFSNYIFSWQQNDIYSNKNALLFVFENVDSNTYSRMVVDGTNMSNFSSLFEKHQIHIGAAEEDEYANMLLSLNDDYGNNAIDENIIKEVSHLFANLDPKIYDPKVYNIEGIYVELRKLLDFGKTISLDVLKRNYGISLSGSAVSKLDRPGWEEAKKQVLKILDAIETDYMEKNSKHSSSGEYIDLMRLMKNSVEPESEKGKLFYNIALSGPPGVGKTTIAKIIYEILAEKGVLNGGTFREVSLPDMQSQYIGGTAEKTREVLLSGIGGCTVLNEAYGLTPSIGLRDAHNYGREALTVMADLLDRYIGEGVFIINGYQEEIMNFLKSNDGMPRRFPHRISIKGYDAETLEKILRYQIKTEGLTLSNSLDAKFSQFVRNWYDARDRKTFGNAGDCSNMVSMLKPVVLKKGRIEIMEEDFNGINLNDVWKNLSDYLPT